MAKPARDYYEVLGVERDADQRTIKRAFLKLARTMHPDVSHEPDAEEKFKEINEAYSVLSDETKRANYDRFGDAEGPSVFGGSAGMDDFFSGFGGFGGMADIFNDFFGGGAAHAQGAQTRGRDMQVTLTITLEQAAAGLERTITYDRLSPCEDCHGTGAQDGSMPEVCPECHGTGYVTAWHHTMLGRMQVQETCPVCHGTGTVIEHVCETCDGQGRTPSREKVTIKVPAGIQNGQHLVIEGAGEAGMRGERAGDLVVGIRIEEGPNRARQGDDLIYLVSIDAFEAMLGATIELDGILADEKITLEVPAGTQNGERLMVANKGMPHLGVPERRGSLIAVIDVKTPVLEGEAAALAMQAARAHGSRVTGAELASAAAADGAAVDGQVADAGAASPDAAPAPEPEAAVDEAHEGAPKRRTKKRGLFNKRKKRRS